MFPVTPMLDMAFQLLAFFVLTFQAPSAETHLDLDLPATPAALPSGAHGEAQPTPLQKVDSDLENDLWVRVEADDLGDLKSLRLGEAALADVATLGDRLRRYAEILDGKPLRVRLVADDTLRYEVAAQVIAACSAAGVSAIRLTTPSASPFPFPLAPDHGGGAMTGKAAVLALLTLASLSSGRTRADDEGRESSLSLSDLAPYRAALEKRPGGTPTPAKAVTFRDLWDRPETYQGHRVRVNGRVVRRFRQGAFGTFPPLTEVWAVAPAGDPFCLVFPTPAGSGPADAAPGASVRFEGTFLRRLRYQGGDTARLAPLIVGDGPPSVTTPAPPKGRRASDAAVLARGCPTAARPGSSGPSASSSPPSSR